MNHNPTSKHNCFQETARQTLQHLHWLNQRLDSKCLPQSKQDINVLKQVFAATRQFQDNLLAWGIHYAMDDPEIRYSFILRDKKLKYIRQSPNKRHFFDIPPLVLVSALLVYLTARDLIALSQTSKYLHQSDPPSTTIEKAAYLQCRSRTPHLRKLVVRRYLGESWTRLLQFLEYRERAIQKVCLVSCNTKHSMVIANNQIYTCGEGENFLGQGHLSDGPILYLRPVHFSNRYQAVQVAAGLNHSLVRTNEGLVFSFGSNTDGQLGLGHQEDCNIPQLIETNNFSEKNHIITWIAAGDEHSLIISQDGNVFSFGSNDVGQLGYESSNPFGILPHMMSGLEHVDIVQGAAGQSHSLLVSFDGRVFSCGSCSKGQCGRGRPSKLTEQLNFIPKPIQLCEFSRSLQVSAGGNTSGILTFKGDVFLFGDVNEQQYDVPYKISDTIKFESIMVDQDHAFLVSRDSKVYAFGSRFALGIHQHDLNSPVTSPSLLSALSNIDLESIGTSQYHSMALTSNGNVFSWGMAQGGVLGSNDEDKDQCYPELVPFDSINH